MISRGVLWEIPRNHLDGEDGIIIMSKVTSVYDMFFFQFTVKSIEVQ